MNENAKRLIIENDGQHDPYGAAMSLAFDICETLTSRGADIPCDWQYQSGIGVIDADDLNPALANFNDAELVTIGNDCLAVVDECKRIYLATHETEIEG